MNVGNYAAATTHSFVGVLCLFFVVAVNLRLLSLTVCTRLRPLRYNIAISRVPISPPSFTKDTHQYFTKPSPVDVGDYIEFLAEIDLLVSASTCPQGDVSIACGDGGSSGGGGGGGGGEGTAEPVVYPLGVEIYALNDPTYLPSHGWKPSPRNGYSGNHGMTITECPPACAKVSTTDPMSGPQRSGENKTNKTRLLTWDTSKTKLSDHIYSIGSASDFLSTTAFLLNYMQRTYPDGGDIATALLEKQDFDFEKVKPKYKVSQLEKTDPQYEHERRCFQLEFEVQITEFVKRQSKYRSNCRRAYAQLWSQCDEKLQNKIMDRSDFSTKIEDNPFELMKVIEELSTSYEDGTYAMATIADAMRNLFLIKQRANESLAHYTSRFQNARDIAVSQLGGEIILHRMVDTAKDPKNMNGALQNESWERLMAYIYMDGALKARYGSLMEHLEDQQLLKTNLYPKTIDRAAAVLDAHFWDSKRKDGK